jgi:O-antigen/teichoic acid export membrane protein
VNDNYTGGNLKKDYLWNTIGTSVNSFLSLLLLIVVTRLNGIDAAGLFSFSFAFALVFFTIGLYGGRIYQVSDVRNEFSSRNYIVLKFVTSAIMLITAAATILINHYDANKGGLMLLLVLYKVSEVIADALYGVIQKNNKLYLAGISLTLKGAVGFAAFLVIDLITKNLLLSGASLLFVNLLFMISYDRINVKRLERVTVRLDRIREDAADSLRLMKKCIYIFLFSFLTTAMANIPRFFIDIYHESDQGYFGILIMPATLIALLVTFIIQPGIVPLSELHKNRQYDRFKKTVGKLTFLSLALGVAAIPVAYLIGGPVLTLIYGVDLTPYRLELAKVVFGGTLNVVAMIYSNALVIIRKQFIQLVIYLISLTTITAMCVLLVNPYGISGGIWSYIIANTVQGALFIATYHVILNRIQSPH